MGKFKDIATQDIERSKQIEKDLIELVKEHNNFIDMRNANEEHDKCYGVIFDYGIEEYRECRIIALTTFDNAAELGVLVADNDECAMEYFDMTEKELLECDAWYTPGGGSLWVNATLIGICECVEQYV